VSPALAVSIVADMSKRNSVQRAFDAFGKAHFQEKRSGTWVRKINGVEQTFNLQRSQYSLSYYLNVQFDFTAAVRPEMAHDENDLDVPFYIEGRAERFFNEDDSSRLRNLLNIEDYPLEEEHREHELLAFLGAKLQPVLSDLDSLDGIKTYHRTGIFGAFLISRSARRVLVASAPE
jgi:hypothetical protein